MTPFTPHRDRIRRAMTLVELVLSLVILSVLMAGMMSAITIAARATPSAASPVLEQRDLAQALDRLASELTLATSISELTNTAITFTLPDRGHGSAGPETVRYAWSGTANAPLTRSYNGATPATLVPQVTAFRLTPDIIPGTLTAPPKVVMVVYNPASLSTEESVRDLKLKAWGFTVSYFNGTGTQAQFDAACAANDVVYIPAGFYSLVIASRIQNPAVGIVTENESVYSAVGISSTVSLNSSNKIKLANTTHEITAGLLIGDRTVLSSDEKLHTLSGTIAPDAVFLTDQGNSEGDLALLELAGRQHNNTPARARRVALPWGGYLLDPLLFWNLKSDARTILKRSLVWAAAPIVYNRISLTIATPTVTRSEMQVDLPNQPRVPRP